MSKLTLKKHLQSLDNEQIIEVVLELYDTMKPVKEYFEFYMNPNENKMLEKYRAVIVSEFYPKEKRGFAKTRFSVCKKAIADFRALKPAPELLADLMLTLPELACKFTFEYGDMSDQYYTSAYNNFKVAIDFLQKNKLLKQFKLRCETCVKHSVHCGYGFEDEMSFLYDMHFNIE